MKLVVAIPSGEMIYADMAFSMNATCIDALIQKIPLAAILNKKVSMVAKARCELVDEALQIGATHILFIDSDHSFPRDLIARLWKADKDIIGILCTTKKTPVRSNAVDLKNNPVLPKTGLEEVARVGTGIMLIKTEVFKKMKRPFFNTKYEQGFMKEAKWIGEDYYFCEQARHKGAHIFVDHDLSRECYHLGQTGYSIEALERKHGDKDITK